ATGGAVNTGPAVNASYCILDVPGGGQYGFNVASGYQPQIISGVRVVGIRHRDVESVGCGVLLDRKDVVALGQMLRDDVDGAVFRLLAREIDVGNAHLLGPGLGNVAIERETQLDQNFAELRATLLGGILRLL